jgi:hypothetical protein
MKRKLLVVLLALSLGAVVVPVLHAECPQPRSFYCRWYMFFEWLTDNTFP